MRGVQNAPPPPTLKQTQSGRVYMMNNGGEFWRIGTLHHLLKKIFTPHLVLVTDELFHRNQFLRDIFFLTAG